MENLESLVARIKNLMVEFDVDATHLVNKGNKSAGARARKVSKELAALMKDFRKLSVAATKKESV